MRQEEQCVKTFNEGQIIQDLFENQITFRIECFPEGFDVYIGDELQELIEGFEIRSFSDAVRALAVTACYLHPESEFASKWKSGLIAYEVD
jgi:hypothetical protein